MRSYGIVLAVSLCWTAACLARNIPVDDANLDRLQQFERKAYDLYADNFGIEMELANDIEGKPDEHTLEVCQLETLLAQISEQTFEINKEFVQKFLSYLEEHGGVGSAKEPNKLELTVALGQLRATATVLEMTADKWRQIVVLVQRNKSKPFVDKFIEQLAAYLRETLDLEEQQRRIDELFRSPFGEWKDVSLIEQADEAVDQVLACSKVCKRIGLAGVRSVISGARWSEISGGYDFAQFSMKPAKVAVDVVAEAEKIRLSDLLAFRLKVISGQL